MLVQHFFDPNTSTLTYVVFDPQSLDAVIIDPVLDFDQASGKVEDKSAQTVINFVQTKKLKVHNILETHAHADHLSSAQILKKTFPDAKLAISERIKIVQSEFKKIFNLKDNQASLDDFDLLLKDFEIYKAGTLSFKVLPTPGHTPACTSFLIKDCLFTGDALFMPDAGTGRCDFPQGSANVLYDSIQSIYQLPDETKIYVCHDYQPAQRELKFQTTVGESKKNNIQLNAKTSKEEYKTFREARDKTLSAPKLILPSLQVNIAGGKLPESESNGVSYLKLPLKFSGSI